MRTLAPIVTDYAGRVDFYLVSFSENTAALDGYIAENGCAKRPGRRRGEFARLAP